MKDKDDQLFLAVKENDYFSYNQLFLRFYKPLCLFVCQFIGDIDASEDIVQELFIRLWTDRSRITIHESLSAYLYKSSKNAALNYLRSEKNRQKTIHALPQNYFQPEDHFAEQEEFLMFLQECIDQLPGRSRQVFLMNRMDGQKHAEIADELHISVKTIKNQIWKSLQYIRNCLQSKEVL